MRSDARKRLAEGSHQIHPDPAVCELIERERRAAAEKAWDEGKAAERRDWEFTFDLVTPDEVRQPWTNPYRVGLGGAQ